MLTGCCLLLSVLAVSVVCVQQVRDDNLAFVQTCWTFINSDSLLTWAQKVGLDFHFAVEQRARSFLGHFFNFNGTAGVLGVGTLLWRGAAAAHVLAP